MGKTKEEMYELLRFVVPLLPTDKPNHLLGIGDLPSIDFGVQQGIDTFDSSHPTRCARHGLLFTSQGNKKILHSAHKEDFNPIDKNCTCFVCKNYSMAYLQHLFKSNEMTGFTLATIHNIHFMVQLMAEYRRKILNDEL